jgi:Cdc6-like AAA superfamily ATPase
LDEVDQLDGEALYDLLRLNQYVKNPIGLVFISNYDDVFLNAEPRIKSSLDTIEMQFRPYTITEMKDILTSRAKDAFRSFESAAIMLCANQAVQKGGDVRIGLQCLLKAGREAEKKSEKKLKVLHVKNVIKGVKETKSDVLKEKINDNEKILLQVLEKEKKRKFTASELYDSYKVVAKKSGARPVSDRAIRDAVNHLRDIGLIEVSDKKVGKSRLIWKSDKWKKRGES